MLIHSLIVLSAMPLLALFGQDSHLLHVKGAGKIAIPATLAEIRLGVEIEGKNSQQLQTQLSENLNGITEAFKKESGLKWETTYFNVSPEYNEGQPRQIKGYRGTAEIAITVANEQAGKWIALAMSLGATKVIGIELKASEEESSRARREAVKRACQEALFLAEAAFEALNLEKEEIIEVDLNPQDMIVRPFRAAVAFNALEKGMSGPEVAGEQIVQSEIGLKIRFNKTTSQN